MARERGAARLRRTNNSSLVMGAFFKGELVGMAGFFRERHLKTRHKGRIWGVYVRANYRGRRLGRGLLVALLERVKKLRGLEQVSLSVSSTQKAAKKLYRSLGFESFGVEDKALKIGDQYLDQEYMVLRLNDDVNRAKRRFSVMPAPRATATARTRASTRRAPAGMGPAARSAA